jgi:general secretion pathway protein L
MAIVIRRVLGLDLGSHGVKAVELHQTLQGLVVVQQRTLPLGDEEGNPLDERLREFARAYALPKEHVICALPGDRLSSRRLTFPFRDGKRLSQAVPFEVEGQLPFDLEDVFVDWERVGGDRQHSEVLATVAPRTEVVKLLRLLREADLEPRVVEADGLVLGNLSALLPLPGTRLLLDLGHRKSTFSLSLDGRVVSTRTIQLGGLALTQALARERGCSEVEAERQKCELGIFGESGEANSPAALAVLDRLVREIVRTLSALEPLLGGPAVARLDEITLLGGTARLPQIDLHLAQRTGIATARIDVPAVVGGASVLAGGDPLIYTPALALALRGTFQARTQMNFRQENLAYRRDLRAVGQEFVWTGRLAALALVLLVLSIGTSIAVQSRRARQIQQIVAGEYASVFPGKALPSNVIAALREALKSAHDRAEFLGVNAANLSALDILTALSAQVPPDLDVVFEEVGIDPNVVRIRGYSKSFEAVERLKTELSKLEGFSQVQVSEIQSDARRGGKSFSVTLTGKPRGEG